MTAVLRTRLSKAALSLLAGHMVLFALYWALLNVPESNASMLAVSALVALVLVLGAGVIEADALLRLGTDLPWRDRLWQAFRTSGTLVVAIAVWLGVSWACGWVESWHAAHSGEIDAWFIAHVDWTNIAWLHRAIEWLLRFVRYAIGTSLAVALLAAGVLEGAASVLRLRWVRVALSLIRLLTIAGIVALFVWLPWRAAWWRPAFLPPNAIEPVFGAIKLFVLAVVMHFGWALILARAAATHTTPRTPESTAPEGVPEVPAPAPLQQEAP